MRLYSPTISDLDPAWVATLNAEKRRRRVSLRLFVLSLSCGMLLSAGATSILYDAVRSPHHLSHREAINVLQDDTLQDIERKRAAVRVYEIARMCVKSLRQAATKNSAPGKEAHNALELLRPLVY